MALQSTCASRPALQVEGCPEVQGAYSVVHIMLDDVGPEWFSLYSATNLWSAPAYQYPSQPWLDSIAAKGVVYDFFFAHPVCSPTRASILTGRLPWRTQIGSAVNAGATVQLEATSHPLPAVMRAVNGRESQLVGKFHLGAGRDDGYAPIERAGFTEYAGVLTNPNVQNSGPEAAPPYTHTGDYTHFWKTTASLAAGSATKSYSVGTFMGTDEHDELVAWLGARTAPFYAQWWVHSAHSVVDPIADTAGPGGTQLTTEFDYLGQAPLSSDSVGTGDPEGPCNVLWRRTHAHLEAVDALCARVEASIPAALRARTIFIISADNGSDVTPMTSVPDEHFGVGQQQPPAGVYPTDHLKGTLYQGGIHEPLIIGGTPIAAGIRGTHSSQLVSVVDLYPTILDIAAPGWQYYLAEQEALDQVDGISLLPTLTSSVGHTAREYAISSTYSPNGPAADATAIKHGVLSTSRWKLVSIDGVEELYYLGGTGGIAHGQAADPTEQTDLMALAGTDADVAAEYAALRAYLLANT